MICPNCGVPVSSRKDICEQCGADLSAYRKLILVSNDHYNQGLLKASVHDLSGAVKELEKSLEYNKKNIDARNLLGLVYFEMGEIVLALAQWVISKNMEPEDNESDYFMDRIQDDRAELDNLNLAIRKYNLGLAAAKEGNDDTAIIQLKKALSINPKFLRASQLLGLLYIKGNDYTKAKNVLEAARKNDISNTTTLRYLAEIDRASGVSEYGEKNYWSRESEESTDSTHSSFLPRSSYKEEKPNLWAFINLLIGVVIGITVVYYLFVPTIRNNIKEEYNQAKVDYSSELSTKSSTIAQQEKRIASLEKKNTELSEQLEDALNVQPTVIEVDTENYSAFFDVWASYTSLKSREYSDEELETLALDLWSLDTTGIENAYAQGLITSMKDDIYPLAAKKIYKSGRKLYDEKNYEQAAGMLAAAVEFNPESDTAMYYLGKSLQALERYEEAATYYRLMLEVCPNSTLKEYIPSRLEECGYKE